MSSRSIVVLLSFGAAIAAQSITATTTSPIAVSATSGVVTTNASAPAGPLVAPTVFSYVLGTGTSAAGGELSWVAFSSPHRILGSASFLGEVDGPAAGAAQAQANDIVMLLTLPQPTLVRIDLDLTISAPAGVPIPTTRIDVGNDGSFELTESSLLPFATVYRTLGPTPLAVRLQVDAAIAVAGMMQAGVQFEVTPGPQTSVVTALAGCGGDHDVKTRFDGGVDLFFFHSTAMPAVGVIGLSVQPLLLSTYFGSGCTLLPAAHVLVYLPATQAMTVPLPPAVRPVSLWTQNVSLGFAGLVTSDSFRIDAQ